MAIYRDLDQDALDYAYNARAQVPEFETHFARWAELSNLTRSRLRDCLASHCYGRGEREQLDIFHPGGAAAVPVLIFVHGGYWRSLDSSLFHFLADFWLPKGVAVALPRYPLAPHASLNEIVAALERALGWIAGNAGPLGLDLSRVALAGHSAGAHLALLLAGCGRAGGIAPRAVVGASGIYDLEPIRLSYLNADLNLDEEDVARLSPLRAAEKLPDRLLLVGGRESSEFVRQSREMAGRHGAALEVREGDNHFTIVDQLSTPSAATRWLSARISSPRSPSETGDSWPVRPSE